MMCGYLLARAGVDVTVLEKHSDFLRDFRGDTVHPSTLEVMHELGLLDQFLSRPHQRLEQIGGRIAGQSVRLADFSHLPTHARFIALTHCFFPAYSAICGVSASSSFVRSTSWMRSSFPNATSWYP